SVSTEGYYDTQRGAELEFDTGNQELNLSQSSESDSGRISRPPLVRETPVSHESARRTTPVNSKPVRPNLSYRSCEFF
ncbi:hypothetical protein Ciccas_012868, partial [Cichlidogyrus casuarinus]